MCLNHFVLIEVCSVDILVACLRTSTGFQGDFFRETHLWEHFGRTSDRQSCSHNVSQKFKRIKCFSKKHMQMDGTNSQQISRLFLGKQGYHSGWLSDPHHRNHKSLAIANHNFEVASRIPKWNRSKIAVLEVFSESQWIFWVAIAVASDLRFEVAAIRVTKAVDSAKTWWNAKKRLLKHCTQGGWESHPGGVYKLQCVFFVYVKVFLWKSYRKRGGK